MFDSSNVAQDSIIPSTSIELPILEKMGIWFELLPQDWPLGFATPIKSPTLLEQLQFTKDKTDYCWYTTQIIINEQDAGKGVLQCEGIADIASIFIDGQRVAYTKGPLYENRILWPDKADKKLLESYACTPDANFKQNFEFTISSGKHELSILCSALGLIKIEFMLGLVNMIEERKGLWNNIYWQKQQLSHWSIFPYLLGERMKIVETFGNTLSWKDTKGSSQGPFWFKASFAKPIEEVPIVIDLGSMQKGMIFVNGQMISRYWTIPASSRDCVLEGWKMPFEYIESKEPTERYYRIPVEWMKSKNELLIFEEFGGNPEKIVFSTPKT